MKISPMEAVLLHAGGRTDRKRDRHDDANNRFGNFANALDDDDDDNNNNNNNNNITNSKNYVRV
jgi:hypothetical protein